MNPVGKFYETKQYCKGRTKAFPPKKQGATIMLGSIYCVSNEVKAVDRGSRQVGWPSKNIFLPRRFVEIEVRYSRIGQRPLRSLSFTIVTVPK